MKTLIFASGLAVLLGVGAAQAAIQRVTLTVPTMDCETCPLTIKVALLKVPGVSRAVVSYARRTAIVTFDDAKTNIAALTRATDAAGYPSFLAEDK
ncbi:MAG: mercury resistance system periplasmic binding protein MerP [Burkholderiales bacterium]|nr:mercury resistance system periplasmic binding protein MerP [Burkholderiales bacterium]